MSITIALDFDGTLTTHEFPEIGKNIGSQEVLKKLVQKGHKLILFTMRSGEYLNAAVKWCEENDIPLFGVQFHPTQHTWTTSNKCYANLFIDDAAVGCPLKIDETLSERPFVDWEKMEQLLLEHGLL